MRDMDIVEELNGVYEQGASELALQAAAEITRLRSALLTCVQTFDKDQRLVDEADAFRAVEIARTALETLEDSNDR